MLTLEHRVHSQANNLWVSFAPPSFFALALAACRLTFVLACLLAFFTHAFPPPPFPSDWLVPSFLCALLSPQTHVHARQCAQECKLVGCAMFQVSEAPSSRPDTGNIKNLASISARQQHQQNQGQECDIPKNVSSWMREAQSSCSSNTNNLHEHSSPDNQHSPMSFHPNTASPGS